jgi:hypothetical protein
LAILGREPAAFAAFDDQRIVVSHLRKTMPVSDLLVSWVRHRSIHLGAFAVRIAARNR